MNEQSEKKEKTLIEAANFPRHFQKTYVLKYFWFSNLSLLASKKYYLKIYILGMTGKKMFEF